MSAMKTHIHENIWVAWYAVERLLLDAVIFLSTLSLSKTSIPLYLEQGVHPYITNGMIFIVGCMQAVIEQWVVTKQQSMNAIHNKRAFRI